MERLLRWATRMARAGAWVSGALILVSAFLITADVLMRKLLDLSVLNMAEVSGYVLAVSTAWGITFTLTERAHVRIDSLYSLLPIRLCAALDIVSLLAFMAFMAFVTWFGFGVFTESARLGSHSLTPLATPLAIPQSVWVLGFAFFMVVMLLLLVRGVTAFVTGDVIRVQQLLGSRTATQELEEAIEEQQALERAGRGGG